jgi:hypothetical protein
MKKKVKKLVLAKETVMSLRAGETKQIGGMEWPRSGLIPCIIDSQNTCARHDGCPSYQCQTL